MVEATTTRPLDTLRGVALLDDPVRNKGTAFSREERRRYGLEGLLPQSVESIDRQVERPRNIRGWIERQLYQPHY